MKKTLAITILVLISLAAGQESRAAAINKLEAEEIFNRANTLYKENKYREAGGEYEKLLELGFSGGNLYYNLANSYFKQGQPGRALLNYERAGQFMPGDSDLRSNYDHCRSVLNLRQDDFAGNKAGIWISRIFHGVSIDAMVIFLSIIYWLVFLILILRLFFSRIRKPALPFLFILMILFIICAVSLDRKITCLDRGAVITAPSAEARFEPVETATAYFSLNEGDKVMVLELSGSWYKVKRSDGKTGWVEKPALELLSL